MLIKLRNIILLLCMVLGTLNVYGQLGRMATPEDDKPDRFYSVALGWAPYCSSAISDRRLSAFHGEFVLSDPQNRKQYKVRAQYQWENQLYPFDLDLLPKSLHYLIPNDYYERIMSGDFLFGYNFLKPSLSQLQVYGGLRVSYLQTRYAEDTYVYQSNLKVVSVPRYHWNFNFSIPLSVEYGYHVSRLLYVGIEPEYSLALSSKVLYETKLRFYGVDERLTAPEEIKFRSQFMIMLHLRYYL